ncbi:MAG: hypothetical protein J2P14_02380 [Acidothermales bacterium]|nr:hypothetical protein [Acidothermales bacterium]
MGIQLTFAAGRTDTGARTFTISASRRRREETRTPRTGRRAPERAAAKPQGRQRESLGRRMWRGVRQSRGVAVARVAGGIGRDLVGMMPLSKMVAGIVNAARQGGQNVQKRWTDVRARQQALGKPTRTRQDRQMSALKGQNTKLRQEVQSLKAQLGSLQQAPAAKRQEQPRRATPSKASRAPAAPQRSGTQQTAKTPAQKQAGTRASTSQRSGNGKAQTSGKTQTSGKAKSSARSSNTQAGGKKATALQSRNGNGKAKPSAKQTRANTRSGR